MPEFGRHLLPLWYLQPDATHLNHGSFGATPRSVLAAQDAIREEMERQPDQFFRHKIMPGPRSAVRPVADRLGAFLGTSGRHIAMVENATAAINAVLSSVTLKPGDEILFIDQAYGAVRVAIEDTCRRTGAVPKRVHIPLPVAREDIIARVSDAIGPKTRLAIIDHITSPTAATIPILEIIRELKAKDVRVLIDGAHAVGQLPLPIDDLGADWYTSNAHKWLYAPKGTAFLYAADHVAETTLPIAISHYHGLKFPDAFDYTGTRDSSAWLALPAALDFVAGFGADKIQAYGRNLAVEGRKLVERLGARPTVSDDMAASIRAYILPQRRAAEPQDWTTLMQTVWDRERVQIAATVFEGRLLLRLSAQIYNERADFEHAVDVIDKLGWPGR